MAVTYMPCPECGDYIAVKLEPRHVQVVDGDLVLHMELTDVALAHLADHDTG